MKKLLFLFTTLLLISCSSNSSEKKDEIQVDETFGDYWVSKGLIIYNKEGVIDLINGGLFQIIDADNVKWGEIDYDSRSKNSDSKLFKLYEVVEDEWDLTNMELKWEYKENVNSTNTIIYCTIQKTSWLCNCRFYNLISLLSLLSIGAFWNSSFLAFIV
jgi:hypothetical protein